jgi:3-phosphoshikimate 1-carboxyvinyltransferase
MDWRSISAEAEAGSLILPSGRISGEVRPPGSKSGTNRAINLAILRARGAGVVSEGIQSSEPSGSGVTLRGALLSEDTELFLEVARGFGLHVEVEGTTVRLGAGRATTTGRFACGNGGTMTRFLVATASVIPGEWLIDGTPRLRERTVAPLVDALRGLGAQIDCLEREGFVPLRVRGGLESGRGELAVALDAGVSSQFLSALLMAGQVAPSPWRIDLRALTSAPYVDLTLEALAAFGGSCRPTATGYAVEPSRLAAGEIAVEIDYSAACYAAAGAALTGGPVSLLGARERSQQGDRRFLDLLAEAGAEVSFGRGGEPAARVSGLASRGLVVDAGDIPDQVPTLAVLGPFLAGGLTVHNAAHLRIKESDRLAAMVEMLTRAGAVAHETADGLRVEGCWASQAPPDREVAIDPKGDHRIAMSAAVLALRRPGLRLEDPGAVVKSYPDFWRDWSVIVQPIP